MGSRSLLLSLVFVAAAGPVSAGALFAEFAPQVNLKQLRSDARALPFPKGVKPAAASALPEGVYQSPKGYFTRIEIAAWADQYLVTGFARYGSSSIPFQAGVTAQGENFFRGAGTLNPAYGKNVTCPQPIELEIKVVAGALYVRSHQPASIPNTYRGTCRNTAPYFWVLHEAAYVK